MKTVWKYDLPVADTVEVEMPQGAELLHVDSQYGVANLIQIWARVDPDGAHDFPNTLVKRRILIRGTGHSVGDEPYVGTVMTSSGLLVWHVFDGGEV